MENRRNKYRVVLVTLLYLSTTLFFELGHTDIVEGGFGTIHRLFNHDCGGKEVHKPLGRDNQCPVCVRNSQTTAYVESSVNLLSPAFELIVTSNISNTFPHRERATAFVRGPPSPLV